MVRPRVAGLTSLCIAVSPQILATYTNLIARDSSEPDPSVSSGKCYYSPGNQADPDYIPCGNTAFGVFSCCAAGSICMDHNACYLDPNTYVAGCTDPAYSDPSCPDKGPYADQQWSGMVNDCNDTSNQWTLCDDAPSGSDTPIFWPGCYCPADESARLVAFTAPGDIPRLINLPSSSGGTMSFFWGYSPSTVLTSTAASTSATTSSSSNAPTASNNEVSPNPTTSRSPTGATSGPPISQSTQHKSSLSTGAKIGIGVGAGLGGFTALAVIAGMAFYIQRLRKRQLEHGDNPKQPHPTLSAEEKDHSDGLARPSPGRSENMSELAGDSRDLSSMTSPVSTLRAWSRPMSTEMEGSIPNHPSMASLRSQELGTDSPVSRVHKSVKEVPVRVHRAPGSGNISQASYRPGTQIGDGVYEMP